MVALPAPVSGRPSVPIATRPRMPVEPTSLERAVRGLQQLHRSEVSVEDALNQVVHTADALFDVDGSGLMLVDEGRALRAVAASDERGQTLEDLQEQLGLGPCVDALVLDVVITARDLAEEPRYAPLAAQVVPLGVRA